MLGQSGHGLSTARSRGGTGSSSNCETDRALDDCKQLISEAFLRGTEWTQVASATCRAA